MNMELSLEKGKTIMSKNRKSIQKHKYCGSFVIMLRNEFRYDIEEIESHLINNFLIHLSTRPGEI